MSALTSFPGFGNSEGKAVNLAGVLLENLTWVEARNRLSADTVVVIALGAAAKEHGPISS